MLKLRLTVLFFLLHLCDDTLFAQCQDSLQIEIYSTKDEDSDYEYQTRTITRFTSTGKKSSVITFDYYSGIWVPASKALYFYDLNDSLIQQTNFNSVDTGWINVSQFLKTFSASGKLIYYNSQRWDGFSWEDVEHRTNSYDASDNLVNTWSEQKISGIWKNQSQVFYYYNNLNNDTLEVYQIGDSVSWINQIRYHFAYDLSGNKIYQLKDVWSNNSWNPKEQIFNFYNSNVLDSTLIQLMDTSWFDQYLHTYTYSPFGQVIRDSIYEWVSPNWLLYEVKIHEVDAFGYPSYWEEFYCSCSTPVDCDCSSIYGYYEDHYDSLGHLLGTYSDPIPGGDGSTSYSYDSNWILLKKEGSSTTMGGIYTARKTEYYYNEITGNNSFCIGSNTTLSVDSCPGYTFLWNTGDTTSSIVADSAGTYTVNVTYPNGFQTYTEPFNLIVDSFPPQFTFAPDSVKNICSNRALNISGQDFSSAQYQWYRNDTAIAGKIYKGIYIYGAALKPGIYYLVAFNACGRDTSAKTIVNILPVPEANISSSGPTTFCEGDSVILTATAGYTYVWDNGNTSQQIIATTGGWRNVVISNSFGCKETAFINLNSIQYPSIPQIIQSGNYLHCTIGANYFQWLLDGDTIPGATSVNYIHPMSGNYSVICAYNPLCPVYSSINYFELCTASINSNSSEVCLGVCNGTITVTCNGLAPFTYSWSTTDTTSTISNLCAGTYIVTITDSQMCTASDTITLFNDSLSIQSLVVHNPGCIGCNDGEILINAIHGDSVYNYTCTPAFGDQSGNLFYNLPAGDYQVCVEDGNSCMACDSVFLIEPNISVSFLSNDKKIIIHPNPFNESITVSYDDAGIKTFQLDILDLHGRKLFHQENISTNSTFNLSHLSGGTYFIKLTDEFGMHFGKIVRQ